MRWASRGAPCRRRSRMRISGSPKCWRRRTCTMSELAEFDRRVARLVADPPAEPTPVSTLDVRARRARLAAKEPAGCDRGRGRGRGDAGGDVAVELHVDRGADRASGDLSRGVSGNRLCRSGRGTRSESGGCRCRAGNDAAAVVAGRFLARVPGPRRTRCGSCDPTADPLARSPAAHNGGSGHRAVGGSRSCTAARHNSPSPTSTGAEAGRRRDASMTSPGRPTARGSRTAC